MRRSAGSRNQKEVDYLKEYLQDHAQWIDEELEPFTSVAQKSDAEVNTALKIKISPNPIHSSATFNYSLDRNGHVTIRVFNILGQEVQTLVNSIQPQGQHVFRWDGRDFAGHAVANGLYFYELSVDGAQMLRSKFVKF